MTGRNPKYNAQVADFTAFEALKPMIQENAALEKKVHNLVNTVKFIVDCAGFEMIGRIQIKDKKSGREFR